MTAQQLKNSILQMAVQGKLVPQDPNDEPASVLLERIKAEKQELIKAGKIKKDKKSSEIFRGASRNLPYAFCEQIGKVIRDISDEVPFEIPDSWEWCRLSDLAIKEIKRGKSPVYAEKGTAMVFAQKCNTKAGKIDLDLAKFLSEAALPKYPDDEYMKNNDIIVNSTGTGTLGRIGIYHDSDNTKNIPLVADSHVTIVRTPENITMYIYHILKYYQPLLEESGEGSTKQKELKPDKIKELFIPIPPLSEQHRIVAKIEELLPFIEKYAQAETQLNALNTSFPEALKKSILQEAVQGRLVPQNPDDEPASVLLERIRAEKQALIKAGKIKKDKHESVIVTRDKIPYEIIDGKERCIADEVPFELPDSWCWCRLGTIFQHNTGKALNSSNHQGTKMQYITTSNLYWDRFELDKLKEMLFTDSEVEKCTVTKGDLLVCEGGDIGRAAIWNYDYPMRIQNHIHRLRSYAPVEVYFFYYVFYLYKRAGLIGGKGIGIQGLSSNAIDQLFMPLPPLDEQRRIVSKIEEIMPYINTI